MILSRQRSAKKIRIQIDQETKEYLKSNTCIDVLR